MTNQSRTSGSKIGWLTVCMYAAAIARGLFWGHAPQRNIFKFDALRLLLRPFLDLSSALSVGLGKLDSDSI